MQKRFSPRLHIGLNYTFSRFTEATEFLNAADAEPWEGISSQTPARPHAVGERHHGELPFGRDRRFGAGMSPIATRSSAVAGAGDLRVPERLPDCVRERLLHRRPRRLGVDNPTLERWFNTDAGFNRVTAQQPTQNLRTFPLRVDSARGDPTNNVDLSLLKNTSLSHGKSLQFRFEAITPSTTRSSRRPRATASTRPTTRSAGSSRRRS